MSIESGAQDGLPVVHITVNQVVAWNMAYWREKAGLKQRELGERIGWTNATVSEAERSWDGKRVREFDAHTVIAIATALGVPLIAMYLPPADDGEAAHYRITLPGGEPQDLSALMAVVMPENNSESAAMEIYRERMHAAAEYYLGPDWAEDTARWMGAADEKELKADRAIRLRRALDAMAQQLGEFYRFADRMEELGQ